MLKSHISWCRLWLTYIGLALVVLLLSSTHATQAQEGVDQADIQIADFTLEGAALDHLIRDALGQAFPDLKLVKVGLHEGQLAILLQSPEREGTRFSELEAKELTQLVDDAVTTLIGDDQEINIGFWFELNGKPFTAFLQPNESANHESAPKPEGLVGAPEGRLSGRTITISPGHGWYYTGSGWNLQRGYYWGVVEDFLTADMVRLLNDYLVAEGATVYSTRELNTNAGNGQSGHPKWQEAARYYIQSLGAPSWVWDSGGSHQDEDIRARPYYANWRSSDILVSVHTNGGGGTGTETWWDTSHASATNSQNLASHLQSQVVNNIRANYDPAWPSRGLKSSAGTLGENRLATRPAAIIEVAFHDKQTPDNAALQNQTFKRLAAQGICNGILAYFGQSGTCGNAPAPVTCSTGQFKAEYFNNRSLSGSPVYSRCENSISHNWGNSGPGNGVNSDNFSVRWTGQFQLASGTYRFTTRTDDGLRLWVDNQSLIDRWYDMGSTTFSADRSLSSGLHTIKMEYYENSGAALASLEWNQATSCSGQYRAEYYNNRTLSGSPTFTRCENWPINHDWGNGGPGNGIGNDNFSVRWTGQAAFGGGTFTFIAASDDGVRVWLDNNMIIDGWRDQGLTEYRHTRSVSSGSHQIKVEYYENGGAATARFRWESAGAGSSANLALNRPASATSQESASYPPSKANDGNINSRWSSRQSSAPGDQWWWVDVGNQTFDRVVIRWEAAYSRTHFVGWSSNCTNYQGYWYNLAGGNVTYNLGTRTARCVGILMRNPRPGMANYSFWEYEVYRGTLRLSFDEKQYEEMPEAVPSGPMVTEEMVIPALPQHSIHLPLIQ